MALENHNSADAGGDRFALPTHSRSTALEREATAPSAEEAAALKAVQEQEAKARLRAIRRIEWVALALVGTLLGGAALASRRQSDALEQRKQAYINSPLFRGGGWSPAKPADIKAATQVIRSQLDAFRRDDYAAAARWQSQNLKGNFPTVERFRRAIKNGYPAFAKSKGVRFGATRARSGGAELEVQALIQGSKGENVAAVYSMVREGEGYRVAGVSEFGGRPRRPAPAPDEPQAPVESA